MSKHSTVLGVFAFSCGVILLYRLTVLPAQVWLLAAAVSVGLIAFLTRRLYSGLYWFLVFGLVSGLFWADLWAHERLVERLPADLEGETAEVSGYVCGLPSEGSFDSIRFSFCVTGWYGHSRTRSSGQPLPTTLRLAWYGQPQGRLPGHRLRLQVVLKRPHGTLNPAGFRYEDWLFRKGYRATGSVRSAVSDSSVPCGVACHYHDLHSRLAQWVDSRFSGAHQYPLIASLLIGNRGYLSSAHWETLKATGTIHLVAISGLHLGLVAIGAGFVARRILLAVPATRITERSVRLGVFVIVLVCCLWYALAAGFTVPTRRALLMVTVGSWYVLNARQVPVWHSLVMALGLVLLLDPFAPLDQGFWLSFGAVSILICVFAGRLKSPGWLAGLLLAQGAVFAGLWPLLAQLGQGQPVAGLLANVIAIPWVSLIVMPVLIIGALVVALLPSLLAFIIPVFDTVLGGLWGTLEWVAGMHWPTLNSTALEIIAFAVVVLLIATLPFRAFQVTAGLLVLGWAVASGSPAELGNPDIGEPEVTVWDVGQGLSAMLRSGDQVLLYDTGPEVKGVFSAAESVLIPNLRALGVQRIHTLVISHADNDHSGGIDLLLKAFDVGTIITGEPTAVRARLSDEPSVTVQGCAGEGVMGEKVFLSFWQAGPDLEGNDASCVLTMRTNDTAAEWVFPGDISAGIEARYLTAVQNRLSAVQPQQRIVIAPHHGSKTSSSTRWVEGLSPDLVIYTAGYRHRYGHPHEDVTARYRQAGARALNTACSGSLVMAMAEGELSLREARHTAPFWIAGPGLTRARCKIP
nr:DNA internalization-related competence protein ComEC/Rec2 [Marinobacter adhaerens]